MKNTPLTELRNELRQLRAEMKRLGVRKISCFNGGLSPAESRMNTERFRLESEIARLSTPVK